MAGSVWPGAPLTTCHSIKVSRGRGLYVPGPCFDLQMGARRRTCRTWTSRVGVGTGLLRDDTLQGNYLHTGSRGGMPGRLSPPEKVHCSHVQHRVREHLSVVKGTLPMEMRSSDWPKTPSPWAVWFGAPGGGGGLSPQPKALITPSSFRAVSS